MGSFEVVLLTACDGRVDGAQWHVNADPPRLARWGGGRLQDTSALFILTPAVSPISSTRALASSRRSHSLPPLNEIVTAALILILSTPDTMPVQDRTNEFRACVESIRNRSSFPQRGAEAKQRLLPNGKGPESKSEFTRMASNIAKEISSTTIKLGKLAQRESPIPQVVAVSSLGAVAKRKTLFDDRPVEISVCSSLVHPLCPMYRRNPPLPGTHLHHQTRHCEHQQGDSCPSVVRQATQCSEREVAGGEAARGAQS